MRAYPAQRCKRYIVYNSINSLGPYLARSKTLCRACHGRFAERESCCFSPAAVAGVTNRSSKSSLFNALLLVYPSQLTSAQLHLHSRAKPAHAHYLICTFEQALMDCTELKPLDLSGARHHHALAVHAEVASVAGTCHHCSSGQPLIPPKTTHTSASACQC